MGCYVIALLHIYHKQTAYSFSISTSRYVIPMCFHLCSFAISVDKKLIHRATLLRAGSSIYLPRKSCKTYTSKPSLILLLLKVYEKIATWNLLHFTLDWIDPFNVEKGWNRINEERRKLTYVVLLYGTCYFVLHKQHSLSCACQSLILWCLSSTSSLKCGLLLEALQMLITISVLSEMSTAGHNGNNSFHFILFSVELL